MANLSSVTASLPALPPVAGTRWRISIIKSNFEMFQITAGACKNSCLQKIYDCNNHNNKEYFLGSELGVFFRLQFILECVKLIASIQGVGKGRWRPTTYRIWNVSLKHLSKWKAETAKNVQSWCAWRLWLEWDQIRVEGNSGYEGIIYAGHHAPLPWELCMIGRRAAWLDPMLDPSQLHKPNLSQGFSLRGKTLAP